VSSWFISKKISLAVLVIIVAGLLSTYLYFVIFYPMLTSTLPTSATVTVNPSLVSLELEITSSEGMREFKDIAIIEVDDVDSLLFRIVDSRVEKLESLSLSGRVRLESGEKTYEISMPCILFPASSCPRITMIIPGYDAPLTIESGRYLLTFELSWREARDSGKVSLMLSPRAYDASMISLGSREPGDTSNWVTAEGSTRSYTLLVDKVEAITDDLGFGEFKAYVWVFQTVGDDVKMFRLELTSIESGIVKAVLDVPVEKKEIYYHVMLAVKARPGSYELSIKHPIQLSIDLRVREG